MKLIKQNRIILIILNLSPSKEVSGQWLHGVSCFKKNFFFKEALEQYSSWPYRIRYCTLYCSYLYIVHRGIDKDSNML